MRQTAGESPVGAISSSLKRGVGKVTEFFTADPVPDSSSDPTSLTNTSNPGPELYVAMARLQEQTGRLTEAEQQYRKALDMAPNDLNATIGMARLRDRQGRLSEAIEFWQKAAQAHPNVAPVHNGLGLCYARDRKYAEAIRELTFAVQLDSKQKLYRNNLATVLVESGDNDAALKHLVAAHGEAIAFYNLGYLLHKKGQSDLAKELFAKAVEKDPSLTEAQIWLERLQAAQPTGERNPKETAASSRPPLPSSLEPPTPTQNHFVRQIPPPIESRTQNAPTVQVRRPENTSLTVRQLPPTDNRAANFGPPPSSPPVIAEKSERSPVSFEQNRDLVTAPQQKIDRVPIPDAPLPSEWPIGPRLHPLPPVDAGPR